MSDQSARFYDLAKIAELTAENEKLKAEIEKLKQELLNAQDEHKLGFYIECCEQQEATIAELQAKIAAADGRSPAPSG